MKPGLDVKRFDKMVRSIAGRYRWAICGNIGFDDLVQEATMGLMRAWEKFDPDKGTFPAYARHHISVYCQRYVEDQARTVRVPAHVQVTRRAMARHAARSGRQLFEVDVDAEAERLQVSKAAAKRALETPTNGSLSLDAPPTGDGGDAWIENLTGNDQGPEQLLERYQEAALSRDALARLPERYRKILAGLHFDGVCANEVARREGVSGQRIRQQIPKAEDRMRQSYATLGGGR